MSAAYECGGIMCFCAGCVFYILLGGFLGYLFFFFSSRRRHTRCREVSWARRCVQETGLVALISLSLLPVPPSDLRSSFLFLPRSVCTPRSSIPIPRSPFSTPRSLRAVGALHIRSLRVSSSAPLLPARRIV
eukprot:TRINITY_DN21230_c0_g1_i1.p2 TRINITY_DN21230_c0_g1~~TRINITY_DN21230_c0_g1_i1.p2  ORF type:complete len:132 (-),score=24.52 TRINITY_DN21230_c0_g1_i1:283-678(-)